MRDLFPGYYRPTEDEFDRLWEEGVIVFDANVLLNLYRYSEDTRNRFLDLLTMLADRIWLPHQAALEFHRNRPNAIREQEAAFEKLKSRIQTLADQAEEQIQDTIEEERHPVLDPDWIQSRVDEALADLRRTVEGLEEQHPNLLQDDPIRRRIDALFEGSVGDPYENELLQEIRQDARKRYDKQIPPGYEDEDKEVRYRYGDVILWRQVVDYAKEENCPVILVTDERKEDWWWVAKGQTLGPRPELVEEMRDEAGVLFYLYSPERFMEYAREHLQPEIGQDTIDEIRQVGEHIRETVDEVEEERGPIASTVHRALREQPTLWPASSTRKEVETRSSSTGSVSELLSALRQMRDEQRESRQSLEESTAPALFALLAAMSAGEGETEGEKPADHESINGAEVNEDDDET